MSVVRHGVVLPFARFVQYSFERKAMGPLEAFLFLVVV
jgi:hypothetical protein